MIDLLYILGDGLFFLGVIEEIFAAEKQAFWDLALHDWHGYGWRPWGKQRKGIMAWRRGVRRCDEDWSRFAFG